jgi:hypothetical protein
MVHILKKHTRVDHTLYLHPCLLEKHNILMLALYVGSMQDVETSQ